MPEEEGLAYRYDSMPDSPDEVEVTAAASCMRWRERLKAICPSMSYIRLFQGLAYTELLVLLIGIVASLAAGVPLPLIGVLFGQMVNGFNTQACANHGLTTPDAPSKAAFLDDVSDHVVKIVIVAAVNFALIWIYASCWSFLGERIARRLRQCYVRALLSKDMAYFDTLPPGEISTRLSENLILVQNGTSEKMGIFLSSLSYFITSYVISFYLLPALAGQLVSLIPAFLIVSMAGAHFVGKYSSRMSSHLGDASSIASESLTNLRAVQAFEMQRPLAKLFNMHLHLVRRTGLFRALSAATMLGCLFFVAYSANALAFYSGSRMVTERMDGEGGASDTVGSVYTVIFLLLDASFVVGQIAPYMQSFSAAGGAGSQLLETVQQTSPIDPFSGDGLRPCDSDAPLGFRLRGVSLAYPARPNARVLDHLDLDLEPGQRIGLCGFSGSGKSTVVSLLLRLYEPSEGSVTLFDGTSLRDVSVSWLRAQVGLVGQEPVLFDCTVLESIAHGLLGSPAHAHLHEALRWLSRYSFDHTTMPATWHAEAPSEIHEALTDVQKACEEAAHMAYAHDFIAALPQGYLTRVGDAGRSLSGGQKQRIALARAIVKKPRVLILDEATAALDSQSEKVVQAAFDRVSEGRTTIAIAHRLSTIKNYDKIVVMAHGQVMEQGTHDELMEAKSHYARLVYAQTDSTPDDSPSLPAVEPSKAPTSMNEEEPMHGMSMPMPAQPVVAPAIITDVEHAHAVTPRKHANVSYTRSLLRLMRWALVKWPYALLGLAASAIIGGAYSGEAVLFGHVIEALNPCKTPSRIEQQSDMFALFFFVLALIELASYFVSGASFGFVSEWLLLRIRKLVFQVLVSQPLAWYESEKTTPSVMIANLSADTSNLGGLTGTVIGTIFSILVNFVAGITLAHIVAWRIAVVILSMVPILILAGYMRLKVIADFQKRHETAYARSTSVAVEAASSMRTIAALSRERDVLQLFEYSLEKPYRESLGHLVLGNLFLAISLSISYFIYGFAYWWGSKNVAEERYSQVAFFTVLPALLFSAQSSGQLLAFAPDFTKAQVSASNIFSLLDRAHTKVDARIRRARPARTYDEEAKATTMPLGDGGPLSVSFEHVSFTYPGRDIPALQDIHLDIPAGCFAAFIGASGSGKSTAMSLIENFYAPTQGVVRVNGCSTTSTPTHVLREHMAIVPQEAMLFRGSIQFNVALGLLDPLSVPAVAEETQPGAFTEKPSETADGRITEACEAAHLHTAIQAMPDGYRTDIGASGSQLSGGQKQRLAIARALIRRPHLLLLDESTSAMDASSEQAFQDTLNALYQSRQCTIIAIAHRMRTIRSADMIFLFDQGRVIARGTHNELLAASPQYQAMIAHQSLDS